MLVTRLFLTLLRKMFGKCLKSVQARILQLTDAEEFLWVLYLYSENLEI